MIASIARRFLAWGKPTEEERELAKVRQDATALANRELDNLIEQLQANVADAARLLRETALAPPLRRVGQGVVEEVAREQQHRQSKPDG